MQILRSLATAIAATVFLGAAGTTPVQPLGTPELFAPGVISGPANDGTPTFTPDGNTLYFTRSGTGAGTILVSYRKGSSWSKPEIAPFSGVWNDQHPAISPDGTHLVFVSTRPVPGQTDRVAHLWMLTRTASGWSPPVHLPAVVNVGRAIFAPSIAADGTIYFLSISKGEAGRVFQLYRARFVDGAYTQAEPLSFSTPKTADVDPEIAPDQSFLIFASSGRRANDTKEHLYIVHRAGDGWGAVAPLRYPGDDSNGSSNDNEPRISRGGKFVYFSSDRTLALTIPRTLAQARADLERIDTWDDGDANVWIAPFTEAAASSSN